MKDNNVENEAEERSLLDLPCHVLLLLLSKLDVQSLCITSRTCSLMSKMCAHPSLWPHFKDDTWAMWDVRCTLARVLRVPPQVFNVQLDVKRSRRFPVTVPLHNLRPILHITDTEGLADRLSKAVQDQVSKLSASLWRFPSWQQFPPAASLSICRADRSTVRASLRPGAVVPRLVHQLQQAGWPPVPAAAEAANLNPANLSMATAAIGVGDHLPTHGQQGQQEFGLVSWPEQQVHGASSSLDSVSAAVMMAQCLKVCRARCDMLASGQLQQLAGLAGVMLCAASPSGCEPRERLALRRSPAAQVAAAAAGKLPDLATARQFAVGYMSGLGVQQQAAQHLAGAAARLMYLSAATDPSSVSFSLPGKPGWVLMLQQACKVLARLHILQQVCMCGPQPLQQGSVDDYEGAADGSSSSGNGDLGGSTTRTARQLLVPPKSHAEVLSACSPALEAAWPAATAAELQLCLAGLQEFPRAVDIIRCSPASVLRCLHTLEAAASEYASDWGQLCSSEAVSDAIKRMGVLTLQAVLCGTEQQEAQIMAQVLQVALDEKCSTGGSGASFTVGAASMKHGAALPSQQMLVRCAMHVETLRTLSWCLWFLGVVD